MLKRFSKKSLIHYQHLILHNAQLILQKHFLLLFQVKHVPFLIGFLNLIPRQHNSILTPPTHNETTNVIRKMKPSGSPCPLHQISVICLKRCPYLRTYLTEIIHAAWSSGTVPSEWKKACTILIHKKVETDHPANVRPIMLQSAPQKVFTSCLRNKMFTFLVENNYIEHNIQKGFTPKVAGTLEHTAHMAHIINTSPY